MSGPEPADMVARVSRFGVVDYCFAADLDDDDAPAALEELGERGTWRVWEKAIGPRSTLAEAIERIERLRRSRLENK